MSGSTAVTLRDVALACGVHTSTICLALKNAPSIPMATRRRIQAAAEALGYRPNVAARNLALLRLEKTAGAVLPIAWINQEPDRQHWRTDPVARVYGDAARRRAEELGYHLEEIWTREPGMTPGRIVQILRARGITGALFPVHRSFDFSLLGPAWNDFSLVGLNDHRLGEWIDVVCTDHYSNTDAALRRLRQLCYPRIGLVLDAQFDAATSGLVRGCFLRYQSDSSPADQVPVCFAPDEPEEAIASVGEWLREGEPDVVLCRDAALPQRLRDVRRGTHWVQLHGPVEQFDAGIEAPAADLAAAAVECVTEKMRRFDTGVRETTCVHMLKGPWREHRLEQEVPQTVVA